MLPFVSSRTARGIDLALISGLFFVYYAIPCCAASGSLYPTTRQAATGSGFLVARQWPPCRFRGRTHDSAAFKQSQVADQQLARRLHRSRWRDLLSLASSAAAWLAGLVVGVVRSIVLNADLDLLLPSRPYASLGMLSARPGVALGGLLLLILLALSNLLLVAA